MDTVLAFLVMIIPVVLAATLLAIVTLLQIAALDIGIPLARTPGIDRSGLSSVEPSSHLKEIAPEHYLI